MRQKILPFLLIFRGYDWPNVRIRVHRAMSENSRRFTTMDRFRRPSKVVLSQEQEQKQYPEPFKPMTPTDSPSNSSNSSSNPSFLFNSKNQNQSALPVDEFAEIWGVTPDHESLTFSSSSTQQGSSSLPSHSTPHPSSYSSILSSTSHLSRTAHPLVEIKLSECQFEYDLLPLHVTIASQIRFVVSDWSIIDHVASSTWKKFLTIAKSGTTISRNENGQDSEEGVDGILIQLKSVRPNLDRPEDQELRLKVDRYRRMIILLICLECGEDSPIIFDSSRI